MNDNQAFQEYTALMPIKLYEQDLEEYDCPEAQNEHYQTIQVCEGKGQGKGCNNLKTCSIYLKMKKITEKYGEIEKITDENILQEIRLIKRDVLLLKVN